MFKKLIFLSISAMTIFFSQAQTVVKYNYDNAGNRVYRGIIVMESTLKSGSIDIDSSEYKQKILEEKIGEFTVKIYPNPTDGIIKVEVQGYKPELKMHAFLYSLKGTQLQTKVFDSSEIMLDLTSYPLGAYMLRIRINGKVLDWKIVKK
jgi:hypothetical protein